MPVVVLSCWRPVFRAKRFGHREMGSEGSLQIQTPDEVRSWRGGKVSNRLLQIPEVFLEKSTPLPAVVLLTSR